MPSKKLERKKAMEKLIRRDILESAVAIIQESGNKQLTMDRVAAGAGIAKGTVYLYYKDKQELLDSVVEFRFEPLEREYAAIIGKEADPVWKLEQCMRASLELVEKKKSLFKGLQNVMFNTRDQFIANPESWYWTTVKLFATALDEGIKTGKLRQMNTVKIASLFLDSINALTSQRILSAVTESIEEEVREVMELYINGITN